MSKTWARDGHEAGISIIDYGGIKGKLRNGLEFQL
jgi:hypothetical protein